MQDSLNISSRAFWDIDINQLNVDSHDAFIISRVFNYGKWDDILAVIKFYGENKVIEHLLNTDFLNDSALHLGSSIFTINKEKFKYYTNRQYPSSYSKTLLS